MERDSNGDLMEPEILDDEQQSSQLTGIPEIDITIAGFSLAAHAVSQISYYRYKIQELDIKRKALKNKLKSEESAIKELSKIELKEIEKQSVNLENILGVVAEKIKNEHIEKKQLLDAMDLLTKAMVDPRVSTEHKQFLLLIENIRLYSETLKNIGNEGVASLNSLAKTTQKAVEASNQKRSNFKLLYSPSKRVE